MQLNNKWGYKIGDRIGDYVINDMEYDNHFHFILHCTCVKCGKNKTARPDGIATYPNAMYHESHIPKMTIDYPIGYTKDDMTVIGYGQVTEPLGKMCNVIICNCNVCGRTKYIRPGNINHNKGIFNHKYCETHDYNGLSCGEYERFFRIWKGMINRCTNPTDLSYPRYGGVGITTEYDDDNKGYIGFFNDLHESYLQHVAEYGEENTTLDRINNFEGYFLNNLRWATHKEQCMNRKITNKLQPTFLSAQFVAKVFAFANKGEPPTRVLPLFSLLG